MSFSSSSMLTKSDEGVALGMVVVVLLWLLVVPSWICTPTSSWIPIVSAAAARLKYINAPSFCEAARICPSKSQCKSQDFSTSLVVSDTSPLPLLPRSSPYTEKRLFALFFGAVFCFLKIMLFFPISNNNFCSNFHQILQNNRK